MLAQFNNIKTQEQIYSKRKELERAMTILSKEGSLTLTRKYKLQAAIDALKWVENIRTIVLSDGVIEMLVQNTLKEKRNERTNIKRTR